VALENVIVKKDDDLLTGTIKVKNVTFEKHVFVRATFDCWANQIDFPAIFVKQGASAIAALFDTFSFSIKVPESAKRFGLIEMCIGYRTPFGEYWDNNNGRNYKLACVVRRNPGFAPTPVLDAPKKLIQPAYDQHCPLVVDWTTFTPWDHILSKGPYW